MTVIVELVFFEGAIYEYLAKILKSSKYSGSSSNESFRQLVQFLSSCIPSSVAEDIHHQCSFIDSLTLRLPGYAQYHFHAGSCGSPVWVT